MLFPGAIEYGVTYLEERMRIRLPAFSDIGYSRHYTIDGRSTRPRRSSVGAPRLAADVTRYA